MNRKVFGFLLIGMLSINVVQAQTLEEVLAKHYEARGGLEKLKSVQSAKSTGQMSSPVTKMVTAFEWTWKRPDKVRTDFTVQGMTASQAYNGEYGWIIVPSGGNLVPQKMDENTQKITEEGSDFEGPLVDFKEKGHKVELVGKEDVEGKEAYKIKLEKKNGNIVVVFLDSEGYLEIKTKRTLTTQSGKAEVETIFGDFKDVGGLILPHSIESKTSGVNMNITFTKYELDVTVEDSVFDMPVVNKKKDSKPTD